jgi:hypothetical protein
MKRGDLVQIKENYRIGDMCSLGLITKVEKDFYGKTLNEYCHSLKGRSDRLTIQWVNGKITVASENYVQILSEA